MSRPVLLLKDPALRLLLVLQAWMNFSRFALMSLLVLFYVRHWHTSDAVAMSMTSLLTSLLFTLPILGGILSDRLLGSYRGLLLGFILMLLGTTVLCFPNQHLWSLGLATIALGGGLFHPNAAPLIQKLYPEPSLCEHALVLDYLAQNGGGLLGIFLCGYLADRYGPIGAFSMAAVGLLSGLMVLNVSSVGRSMLGFEPSSHVSKRSLLKFFLCLIASIPCLAFLFNHTTVGRWFSFCVSFGVFIKIVWDASHADPTFRKKYYALLCVLFQLIAFESFLNQGALTMSLFIDRHVDRSWDSWMIPTSWFFALDPVFILLLGPLWMSRARILKDKNLDEGPSKKFALGFVMMMFAFLMFSWMALYAQHHTHASPWGVVLAYAGLALAELALVPVSLTYITQLAPTHAQATWVAYWMLAKGLGSLLAADWSSAVAYLFPGTFLDQSFKLFSLISLLMLLCIAGALSFRGLLRKVVREGL